MNKRQKAKRYKILYERELALKNQKTFEYVVTYKPTQEYKVKCLVDADLASNEEYIRMKIASEFMKIIEKKLAIKAAEDPYGLFMRSKCFESTIRIAWD